MKNKLNLPSLILTFILLIAWECIALGINATYILPTPIEVIKKLWELRVPLFKVHLPATMGVTLIGLAISIVLGVLLAVLMDAFPKAEKALYPIIIASQTIPTTAIAPLFILWFGSVSYTHLDVYKRQGFLEVYNRVEETENIIKFPKIEENKKLSANKILPEQHFTQPPARYTDASLVKTLEELGKMCIRDRSKTVFADSLAYTNIFFSYFDCFFVESLNYFGNCFVAVLCYNVLHSCLLYTSWIPIKPH